MSGDFTDCGKTRLARSFVTGHEFNRADKANKMRQASAPVNPFFAEFAFLSDFFRSLFSP
jgi:hypothetical protein